MLQKPNAKLSKSKSHLIYSYNLPAGKTCPGAGDCAKFCYAKKGFYVMPSVKNRYELNFEATKDLPAFEEEMGLSIEALIRTAGKKGMIPAVRIHTSGDFYSAEYFKAWVKIAEKFSGVVFYAYTKSPFVRVMIKRGTVKIPNNFVLINSFGSTTDSKIDLNTRHARIFASKAELLAAGYDDTSDDDTIAFLSDSGKIGLVAH